jgi:putative ABC transport system substrate-binding protein
MNTSRRFFLYLAAALSVSFPTIANGQQPSDHVPRVGLLAWWPCDSGEFTSFMRGLRELGFSPDRVNVECRSANKDDRGLAAAASALVDIPVDILVTMSQPAAHAAHEVTKEVPIVTILSGNPVADGLAKSIAKPGGNITGVSYYATELAAKRLQLLMEAVPNLRKIGVLANPIVSYLPFENDTQQAARGLGVSLSVQHVSAPDDLDDAFARMKADGAQAVFVLPDLMLADQSPRIAALAIQHHLPSMAWGPWFAEAGCLMAYSADYSGMAERLAFYVDRILKGAKPGDLPIEQPMHFLLSINMKTANTLGIELPQTLSLMADETVQ